MMVSNDGASAPTISLVFLSKEMPSTRTQPSAPWIAWRLASACRMASGVWPTSMTVNGDGRITSSRPGQRASRSPDRTAASIPGNVRSGMTAMQPEQQQGDGDGGIVELKRAEQPHLERVETDSRRTDSRNVVRPGRRIRPRSRSGRGRTRSTPRDCEDIRSDAAATRRQFSPTTMVPPDAQASLLSETINSSEWPSSSTCS